jgi:hypothetical protein
VVSRRRNCGEYCAVLVTRMPALLSVAAPERTAPLAAAVSVGIPRRREANFGPRFETHLNRRAQRGDPAVGCGTAGAKLSESQPGPPRRPRGGLTHTVLRSRAGVATRGGHRQEITSRTAARPEASRMWNVGFEHLHRVDFNLKTYMSMITL